MSKDIKGTLYIASSLNGLMTKGASDSDWVDDEALFAKISKGIGCILVGRKTFEQFQEIIYPVPDTINIVLSRNDKETDAENVFFVKNIEEALNKMAELSLKKFIVVGGAQTISSCLEKNIIDNVYLSLHPYIFGEGLSIIGDYKKDIKLSYQDIIHQEKNFILLEYKIESSRENHA